ncbi:MAG: GGDEF domain-containing protein [Burkholderiaceae bacterium]|nr:GGDEF domain-containing protein [Burkholderiaceae bacterium]
MPFNPSLPTGSPVAWDSSTIEVSSTDLMTLPALEPQAPRRGCLVLYSGDQIGKRFVLEPGTQILGRAADAGVLLDDPSLSRRHAQLQVGADGVVLVDLDSANGSWVNDRRITAPQRLADGDRLRLGKVRLRYLVQDNPEARVQDQLWRLATVDAATGAWNRRHWLDALQQAVRVAQRGGPAPAVICVDLDHFKRVNDTWGHAAGDEVLQQAVARLQAQLRPGEPLGRLGGEEFAVLLPAASRADALALAERLRAALAGAPMRLSPAAPGQPAVQHLQTASLGVAHWSAAVPDAARLLDAADQRLYEAKRSGRDRVVG